MQLYLVFSLHLGSRSTTPHSNQISPQPLDVPPVDIQSQPVVQRGTSLDDQSEKPLQKGSSDLHNPEESEDEGLDLTDIKDMFKDVIGILVFFEICIQSAWLS